MASMPKASASALGVPLDLLKKIGRLPTSKWTGDPANVRPMLATLADPPLSQPGLIYEPKYDGIRALVDLQPGRGKASPPKVAVYSRNGNDKTAQFPEVVRALQSVGTRVRAPLLLDGEIVALDPSGRPLGFQHIQAVSYTHLTLPTNSRV